MPIINKNKKIKMETIKTYTTTYSENTKSALFNLLDCIINTFNIMGLKSYDILDCGVFCDITTYSNYKHYKDAETEHIAVPRELTDPCFNSEDRYAFVEKTINEIIKGHTIKPQWMSFVEENVIEVDNGLEVRPSTYLYVTPKQEGFSDLVESIDGLLSSIIQTTSAIYD